MTERKLNGAYTKRFKNGNLHKQGTYKDGEKHGRWTEWFGNRRIRKQEHYVNGRRSGEWKEWDIDGQILSQGMYVKGNKEGEWIKWYDNGKLEQHGYYTRGMMDGEWTWWYESGALKEQGVYKADEMNGEWKQWSESGLLKEHSFWKDDEKDGEAKIWYSNGQLSKRSSYIGGVIDGMWEKWYPNGQLLEQGMYKNGKKDGEWMVWHLNGQLAESGYYTKGKKVGEWKVYTEEGVESITKYIMGRVDPEYEYKGVLQDLIKSKDFRNPFDSIHSKLYEPIDDHVSTVLAFPPELLAPIKYYTFHGDGWVNQCLLTEQCTDFVRTLIDAVDDVFEKMPPLSKPLTVYRGVKNEYGVKNVLNYTSTSLLKDKAYEFAGSKGVVWTITVSAGTKIIPLEPITSVPREHEILLPRNGSMFKTTATDLVYVPVGWEYKNDV